MHSARGEKNFGRYRERFNFNRRDDPSSTYKNLKNWKEINMMKALFDGSE